MAAPKVKYTTYRDKNSGEVVRVDGDGAPPHADCQKLVEYHEEEEAEEAPAPKAAAKK